MFYKICSSGRKPVKMLLENLMKTQNILVILGLIFLSSCMNSIITGTDESSRFKIVALSNIEAVNFSVLQSTLLAPHCIRCHAWVSDEEQIIKRIVPGNADLSPLFTQVSSGSMPKGEGRLPQSFIDMLRKYIEGARSTQIPVPPPPIGSKVTFLEIQKKILEPHCINCHDNWDNNEKEFIKKIATNNASESVVFKQIDSGDMPMGGARLPQESIDQVKKYIDSLAVVVDPVEVKASFASIKFHLIEKSCLWCHNHINAERRKIPNFEERTIIQNNADKIIYKITTARELDNKPMPPTASSAPVPKAEVIWAFKEWQLAGFPD